MSKQKLLIKVIENAEMKWIHLCYVDSQIYKKFKNLPGYESLTIGSHISKWLMQDFGVKLSMSTKTDVLMLRNVLKTWYRREYPELYVKCPGGKQRIANIVGIWITQHIQYDIDFYKPNKGGKHK